MDDPKRQLQEATQQIRDSLRGLRENVVQAVMRRNMLQDQLAKLEKLIADLDAKAALADKIHNPTLATELRQERTGREAERTRLKTLLASAEAEAEAAKLGLPEQEASLLRQANELKTQFAQLVSDRIDSNASGGIGTPGDSLWERATDKIRGLESQASAQVEVAGGASSANVPALPAVTPEQSAEAMLSALETRLGMTPEPTTEPPSASTKPAGNARFLELDIAPSARPLAAESPTPAAVPPTENTTALADPIENRGENQEIAKPVTANFQIVTQVQGETARMEPTQRVRVAGIGTGGIYRGAHLPAYPDLSAQAQLVAFCDPDPEAKRLVQEQYNRLIDAKLEQLKERKDQQTTVDRLKKDRDDLLSKPVYDDISEIIAEVKPDLVDICTQPFLHTPLSIQALEAGINVMCEKPISRSWLESQRLIQTVERTGKFYQHNENWLWDPDYYTAKKLVEAGAIGEPILMFLATAHGGPEGNPKFWNSDFGGGGALLDNGIHAIGASWYISGLEKKPVVVKAAQPYGMSIRMPNRIIDGRFQKVQVDNDAHILIRFEDAESGAWTTAHVEGSWSHRDSPDTAIIGTTGKIVFLNEDNRRYAVVMDSYEREQRRIQTSGPTWQHWPSSFYGEILNMVESVRNGVPSISTAYFGADCSAIVGASYLSQKGGKRAVTLDEFKTFARGIAERYPNDPAGADNALIAELLSAVRTR